MSSIVALGAVTVGINLTTTSKELRELGLTPGSYTVPSMERMKRLRLALERSRGTLPEPRSGGSIGNTGNFLARAGVSCGIMGVGGNDDFGRIFVANCKKASLRFLSTLEHGVLTGHDFYLYDENGVRTIIWTAGANALVSPSRINSRAIQNAELLLLDGSVLSYGPESEAAMSQSVQAAKEANIPFVLTLSSVKIVSGYRAFFDTYAAQAQMVAGNLEQTAVLVGLEPEAPLDKVRAELAKTPINAVVTLDAGGVYAQFAGATFLVPTQKTMAADSTGAGDAFLGAFLAARKKGLAIRDALTVGNVVAGKVIQYDSAQLPTSVDVPNLMREAMQVADRVAG